MPVSLLLYAIEGSTEALNYELCPEQARAAFAALQALDFIGPDDLARELLALLTASLRCGASEHAPPISARAVGGFLLECGPGVPERYDDFVTLHNRLVHTARCEP